MTLTIHPYTRKTWKKEVFEMLFDNLYFYVDSPTLEDFKIIIDNLMNSPNDRQMFKDVLVRVQYQQSRKINTKKICQKFKVFHIFGINYISTDILNFYFRMYCTHFKAGSIV